MPSSVGIVIPRRLSGVASGMPAGIERMHGAIGWEVLVPLLLPSFLDVFVQFALTERQLKPDTLSSTILDGCGQFQWRIALLLFPCMLITQTWGIGVGPFGPQSFRKKCTTGL